MALAANPDPYGLGRIPPIPTWIPPVDGRSAAPASALHPEVAGADPLHSRQPGGPGPGRPRRRLAPHRGRRRARHRRRAARPRLQRPRRHRAAGQGHGPDRAGRRVHPGGGVVHARRAGRRREGLRQCPDRRPLGAERRHHLQHLPGPGGAGAGARVASDRDIDQNAAAIRRPVLAEPPAMGSAGNARDEIVGDIKPRPSSTFGRYSGWDAPDREGGRTWRIAGSLRRMGFARRRTAGRTASGPSLVFTTLCGSTARCWRSTTRSSRTSRRNPCSTRSARPCARWSRSIARCSTLPRRMSFARSRWRAGSCRGTRTVRTRRSALRARPQAGRLNTGSRASATISPMEPRLPGTRSCSPEECART